MIDNITNFSSRQEEITEFSQNNVKKVQGLSISAATMNNGSILAENDYFEVLKK